MIRIDRSSAHGEPATVHSVIALESDVMRSVSGLMAMPDHSTPRCDEDDDRGLPQPTYDGQIDDGPKPVPGQATASPPERHVYCRQQ